MRDALDLAGHVALVTGAAGGIGGATVTAFTACGARCLAIDVAGGEGVRRCDVTDEAEVSAAFEEAAVLGPLTDVVHAAGVVSVGAVGDTTLAEFRRVVEINLVGSFLVGREAARRLAPGGVLTFVSSQAGLKSGALWAAYAASKAGVIRLAESLAVELGSRDIRVNAICPGTVDTAMAGRVVEDLAQRRGESAETILERYRAGIPLGRLARREEVAAGCIFLASGLASYVSGTAFLVDGGEISR